MQKVCHAVLALIIHFKTISSRVPKIFLTVFNLLYEGSTVIIIVQAVHTYIQFIEAPFQGLFSHNILTKTN